MAVNFFLNDIYMYFQSVKVGSPIHHTVFSSWSSRKFPKKIQIPLHHRKLDENKTGKSPNHISTLRILTTSCPDYFRWIHEDLRPWMSVGPTRDALERAMAYAHFPLVIVGGKAYGERSKPYQTRDVFTV